MSVQGTMSMQETTSVQGNHECAGDHECAREPKVDRRAERVLGPLGAWSVQFRVSSPRLWVYKKQPRGNMVDLGPRGAPWGL